ncbi:hypothetical protein [Streptomyces sp. WM6372]|uniref:hypothetical protein n=1 Tax=Streptomyces sp. WM6372 TaxID=1415555 RepID=UPI0018FE16BC|nr:hypothetical protein [Streptomyces sp. WM6372]
MSEEATSYDASNIQVLEGWEAVRKRPGMYIGSTSERGLRQMVFEVADRAVNEVLDGRAASVDVTLTPDGGVCVADDGPGISTPLTEAGAATGSGTTIAFWPDADIFGAAEFSFDGLVERFRELAFLNQGLEISLTDLRRPDDSCSVRLRFPGGARDFVAFLDGHSAASAPMDTIAFEHEDPRMAGVMKVAFRWCSCPEKRVRSFANSRPTVDGTHAVGFRDGMRAAVIAYAREQGLLTATDPDFDADRISEGLTAVVSVKLDRPEFEGSTRGVLGNAEVRDCVGQAVQDHLGRWLKDDPERAAAVIDRIVQCARRD